MDLTGKTAFVTGGASGIGRATCLTLAAAGAKVFVADIDETGGAATVEQAGNGAAFVRCDVTSLESIAQAAGTVGLAHIVCNVAGWDVIQPFMQNTDAFMERIVAINYLGQVRVCRAFLPAMIDAGGGKIVNVASDAGRVGSMGETVYAGAKGGVIAFTKSLAREMARHQICVNCIAPGPTDTPLLSAQPERIREALLRAIPFRRLAQPQDIADAILFMASSRANYITGQVLSVSGGLTMSG
jgi:2-hydroxycyclohexanecarboxyl-CoA dehydrogenase